MINSFLEMKNILDKIRQRRQALGWSQEYLAYELKVSIKTYSKLERGETRLTLLRFLEICHLLGLSPSLLLEGLEEKKSSVKPHDNADKNILASDLINFINKY